MNTAAAPAPLATRVADLRGIPLGRLATTTARAAEKPASAPIGAFNSSI
jgi:hypothetical protein